MIFERRCRAHRAMGVLHRSQMVGLARGRRPKLKARTRRSGGQALPVDICAASAEKNFALAGFLGANAPPAADGSFRIFTAGIQAESAYVRAWMLDSLASRTCLTVENVNKQGLTPFPRDLLIRLQ